MTEFIVTNQGVLPKTEEDFYLFEEEVSVYEVIRIVDGIALFLEDHFSRLINSTLIAGLAFNMRLSEFRQKIDELVVVNEKQSGNVKFGIFEIDGKMPWYFSFIPHKYPELNDYKSGVSTGLLFAERQNPGAKVVQKAVRELADQMIEDQGFYEVFLVNRDGMITEGSRSNVFFVKDNRFFTAPESMVLAGITRKKVLECLHELAFPVIETPVLASEISFYDAVFLTGTSPKVLPVNCIGEINFSAGNFFVEQLMLKFNLMIESYLLEKNK